MVINSKSLYGVPVQAKSGTVLGTVASVDFDSETGRLASLKVKTRGLMAGLFNEELSVAWDQILEIRTDLVIVSDTTVPVGARRLAVETGTPAVGNIHFAKKEGEEIA
jgi:sporulation protein YlmC with PRC-barrel domain